MSIFSGIKEKQARGNYSYLNKNGEYLVRIEGAQIVKTRKSDTLCIFNLTILHVIRAHETGSHLPGEEVSWCLDSKQDSFLPTLKGGVACLTQTEPTEIDEAACEIIFGEGQPLKGEFAVFTVVNVPTKRGSTFSVVTPKRVLPLPEVLKIVPSERHESFKLTNAK